MLGGIQQIGRARQTGCRIPECVDPFRGGPVSGWPSRDRRQSPKDAMSQIAQHRKGFCIGQLDHFDRDGGTWREVVVEDRRAGPAETAATRIDFSHWLRLLPKRLRKIALTLASGETTSDSGHEVSCHAREDFSIAIVAEGELGAFQGEVEAGQAQMAAA